MIFAIIDIMEVIEHPKRVKTFRSGGVSLLPIHPPEANTLFLQGMMQVLEIIFDEIGIFYFKRNTHF